MEEEPGLPSRGRHYGHLREHVSFKTANIVIQILWLALNTKASRELERHSLRFLVFRFLLLFSSATRAERLLRKIHLVTRSLRTGSGPRTPAYKKASRALAGPRQCFQQTSHRSDCDWPGRSNPLEQSKLLGQTKPLGPEARLPSRPARHTCRPPTGRDCGIEPSAGAPRTCEAQGSGRVFAFAPRSQARGARNCCDCAVAGAPRGFAPRGSIDFAPSGYQKRQKKAQRRRSRKGRPQSTSCISCVR